MTGRGTRHGYIHFVNPTKQEIKRAKSSVEREEMRPRVTGNHPKGGRENSRDMRRA